MNNRYTNRRLAFLILFCLPFIFTHAQTRSSIENKALYGEIAHMDSVLFNAFNTRDIEKLTTFFSEELEVYQDNTGFRNYTQTIGSFTELFKKEYVLKRELIKQSMEVYPVKDFGAIQTGRHTFCHTENGKPECGTFKFVHIWEKKDGSWKIKRLITYDH